MRNRKLKLRAFENMAGRLENGINYEKYDLIKATVNKLLPPEGKL